MANDEHVALLKQGVTACNAWRDRNPNIRPDLTEAKLQGTNLDEADLSGAILKNADLTDAKLRQANLDRADLCEAILKKADLTGAKLREADLSSANLVEAHCANANFTGSTVFGLSAWGLELDGAIQQNLIITHPDEAEVTVDNIEVAQFVHLLLRNEKIPHAIDTIVKKGSRRGEVQ